MATLEDKILGDKVHNYCSSSSSDGESETENSDSEKPKTCALKNTSTPPLETNKWEGTSVNTGPKGVLKDWQRYKQLETEKRVDDEKEKLELMKKLTLTVQSVLDEEREQAAKDDPEFAELLNDDFLLEYQKQRLQEMIEQNNHSIKFGQMIYLQNGQEFLDAIDKEHKSVKIIVHIYENHVEACRIMNLSLQKLAQVYPYVKFCNLVGSHAGMSNKFKTDGVPALLIYKAGNMVGNFVKLVDEFGESFQTEDVQAFLIEHGMLEDKSCTPLLIRSSADNNDDSD